MSIDRTRLLAERYDREAAAYRDLWGPILRVAGVRLLSELDGVRDERVLDVGTGTGSLLTDLRSRFPGALVLGADRSRGMLALAPAEFPRSVMDATRLALTSDSFDVVLMAFMLFHLDSPADGLREARRVLRHGGRAGSVTWATDLESKASLIWNHCLDAHGAAESDPACEARHASVDEPRKMEALFRDAGFASARSWLGELTYSIEREHLIRLKTSLGSSRPRFAGLEPDAQSACISEVRRHLEGLSPEDFVATGKVVYTVGSV
jgi:ubiquinone/menaquinone biosynthesis C-methylase UbiE